MECVEAKALKTSFWPEMTVKSNQQVVFEDLWVGNGTNGVPGDETFVDDLLDFSNEDDEERVVKKEEEDEKKGFLSISSSQEQKPQFSTGGSLKNEFASVFASELSVPTDDLADLEWLSHFVEDSFSEDMSLQYLDGNPTEKPQTGNPQKRSEPETETPLKPAVGFQTTKARRSKRSRTGGRVWSLGSSSLTETSSSSSSSTSSSSSSSCLIFTNAGQNLEFFDYLGKPPAKKPKKRRQVQVNGGGILLQRRCSHCGVQKTPQWRTGPLGAKTLCNACGVRYKSGRLLPEYRPACSPTFSSDVHSNNHRKVLEMRRKKEMEPPESGLVPAVHSF
ncbi:zinc finger protein [Macleaya cordata]|uniref:GATA transcription factor n=1 Tax=Macleaya cordata TaxID=56857 RepID=A0A200RCF3_MACCD|nr:zinc finger protein [Macleaya cordata]